MAPLEAVWSGLHCLCRAVCPKSLDHYVKLFWRIIWELIKLSDFSSRKWACQHFPGLELQAVRSQYHQQWKNTLTRYRGSWNTHVELCCFRNKSIFVCINFPPQQRIFIRGTVCSSLYMLISATTQTGFSTLVMKTSQKRDSIADFFVTLGAHY